jgi:predicted MFS family arabinose efflux permease
MTDNAATRAAPSDFPPLWRASLILIPFAMGYFMSYLFRAVNAVVAPNLVTDVGLSASELGLLTAAYLVSFALFQLPLGILLDRYGPRRVQVALLLCAAIGALLFSQGNGVVSLSLARALIGIGVAGGLMASFKAVVMWISEDRRQIASATVMSAGALGLIVSTAPMEQAVALAGWRQAFVILAIVTIVVVALIALFVPKDRVSASSVSLATQIQETGAIYTDRAFIALAPMLSATAGTHIAIQTLWAGPWFRDIAGLDRADVAHNLMLMAVAFFVGILMTGVVADRLARRGVHVLDVLLGFVTAFVIAQSVILFGRSPLMMPAWIFFGMLGQVAILAYPWLSKHFGAARSGRANTAMNLLIFAAAFVLQWGIGRIIDLYPKPPGGGYAPEAYRAGFGVCIALQLTAIAYFIYRRRVSARAFSDR